MSAETDLIKKIQELKQIQPDKDWIVSTKTQILGEEPKVLFFPYFKPVFAGLVVFVMLFGSFGFAQDSLPGDILYPLKKITERGQAIFVSEEEKPGFQLKLTNERLEELAQITENNQVEKLAPAISEVQASIVQASQNLKKVKQPRKVAKSIVEESQKLKETQEAIEEVLATKIVSKEVEAEFQEALLPCYKAQAEMLIADLEKSSLTEAQEEMLEKAKEEMEKGDYEKALFEELLPLSYPQE